MEQPIQQPKIDLSQAEWVSCEKGNNTFDTKILFKRISPLLSPTGNEEFFPIEVIVCSTCGKVPKFYADRIKELPANMKSDCK